MADTNPKEVNLPPAPQGDGNLSIKPQAVTPPAQGEVKLVDTAPKVDIPPKVAPAPTTEPSPAVAPQKSPTPVPEKKEKVSFTNIFNKEKSKKRETNVISSVLKKSGPAAKAQPILGTTPALKKSIEADRKTQLRRKLRLVQTVFVIVFFAGLGSAFYFYQELSPTFDLFGQNTTQRLSTVNDNLRSVQTQVNKYRYLAAQLDLNRFSLVSDQFLDKTTQLSGATSAQAATLSRDIAQTASDLPAILLNVRNQLTPDIVVPTTPSEAEEELTSEQIQTNTEDALRNALLADRRAITASSSLTEANEQDIKLIDNTMKIIGNTALLSTIRKSSVDTFEENLTNYASTLEPSLRNTLGTLMRSVLSSTQSDIATIGSIKASRIDWSTIMKQIEDVTRTIDPAFGAGLTQTLGDGIFYTGYAFETTTNKIVLSGSTKTTKADNFTVISNLIEELERSPYFASVDMRSFSKSGSFAEGFTSTFKIDLAIEAGEFSEENSPLSLEPRTIAKTEGVKRN